MTFRNAEIESGFTTPSAENFHKSDANAALTEGVWHRSGNSTPSRSNDSGDLPAAVLTGSTLLGLGGALRLGGESTEVLQARAAAAMASNTSELFNIGKTVLSGEAPRALTAAKVGELASPLITAAECFKSASDIGKGIYDGVKDGDQAEVTHDFENATEALAGASFAALGYVAAERFGLPKFVGTAAGAVLGNAVYDGYQYASKRFWS